MHELLTIGNNLNFHWNMSSNSINTTYKPVLPTQEEENEIVAQFEIKNKTAL